MAVLPSIRQLSFLVALDEERHFGRAAERCHVTQSTLSAGLKELETLLGVAVAERTSRSVLMTPVGRDLAARARGILRETEALTQAAAAARDPLAGVLRLGSVPTIGPYLLPRLMPGLRARFPNLRLHLREELTDSLTAGLASGRLDLILAALPYDLGDVTIATLFTDGYALACPRNHPLANAPLLDGEDLRGRGMLLLEPGHCLQRHALSAYEGLDLQQDPGVEATSLPTLVAMVGAGLGVTLLPDLAIAAGVAEGHEVSLTPLKGARPRDVVLAWRRGDPRGDAFETLATAMRTLRARPVATAATAR
jgi:LysR family hydrogen peroxide-inducible transcriptional activator